MPTLTDGSFQPMRGVSGAEAIQTIDRLQALAARGPQGAGR
jgi:hypothetical protein